MVLGLLLVSKIFIEAAYIIYFHVPHCWEAWKLRAGHIFRVEIGPWGLDSELGSLSRLCICSMRMDEPCIPRGEGGGRFWCSLLSIRPWKLF